MVTRPSEIELEQFLKDFNTRKDIEIRFGINKHQVQQDLSRLNKLKKLDYANLGVLSMRQKTPIIVYKVRLRK